MYDLGIKKAAIALLVIGGIVGAALIATLFSVIPWLWDTAKPWLHSITG